jgi:hypothetical protein
MHLWSAYALLLLQREEVAIPFLQQALIGGAVASSAWQHRCFLYMASAHALIGTSRRPGTRWRRPIGFGHLRR